MNLGSREVRDFCDPYIIAEIGANHNGDMDLAKKMIDAAKECGCDAVKFQSWTPSSLIAKEEYERNQKYDDSPKKHFGSLEEMVRKYYLREDQHVELKKYCDENGMVFLSTPFSVEEVDFLDSLNVPFFKVASMDINNVSLLTHIAQKNKPIVLSTGMATLSEIERAVNTIESQGNNQIILLHCIAIYPPDYGDINLNNIPMLRNTFGYSIGFSDHTMGIAISLASVALGSCVIEKHFTLDRNLPGWDHDISSTPKEMKRIVEESKNIVKALGVHRRVVGEAELLKRKRFRRSIVVKTDLTEGHVLKAEDLTFKRPGTGISPDQLDCVVGRELKRNVSEDEVIYWTDLQ